MSWICHESNGSLVHVPECVRLKDSFTAFAFCVSRAFPLSASNPYLPSKHSLTSHYGLLFTRANTIPTPTPHLPPKIYPSTHSHVLLHPTMSNAARFYWAKLEGATNKFRESKTEAELDNVQDICCQLFNEVRCPRLCQIEARVRSTHKTHHRLFADMRRNYDPNVSRTTTGSPNTA